MIPAGTSRRAGAFLLALALAAAPLVADAQESYRQGLEAYEAGDFPEAARWLTRAIAEDPEASGLLSGTLLRRYTPHYYLGLSLAEMGRCREAIRALDESERQGRVRDRELSTLRSTREACHRIVERVETAAANASEVADGAAAFLYELARLEATPVLGSVWDDGSPSFAYRQEEAAGLLTEARNRIQRGMEALEPATIRQGAELAEQAQERLESLTADATARRDELLPRVRSRLAGLDELARQAGREVRFVRSRFAPLPESLAEVVEVTEASIGGAGRADESTSLALLDQVEGELRSSLRSLRSAVQAPPDEMMEAAAALFAGEYEEVSELLAGRSYREPRANQQSCLLLAAARHGALRVEGRSDPELMAAVRETVAACPSVPSRRELPAKYFSPDFRRIWASLVGEAREEHSEEETPDASE